MPELPEVETLVRTLSPALIGKRILSADLRWRRSLVEPGPRLFIKQIVGQTITLLARRAKFFILHLIGCDLVLHLRMSGDLLAVLGGYMPDQHDRLIMGLSENMTFVFNDPRKFGRIWLLKDPATLFSSLGPEPLGDEFTPAWLFAALHRRRRQLKPLLLDQRFIAGLGNIYTDESLHRARLHPLTPSNTLNESQSALLWESIRLTLQEGIARNGASIDWVYRGGDFQNHFRVYGRTGQECPVCGTPVERILTGQRGTHFCPNCQQYPLK